MCKKALQVAFSLRVVMKKEKKGGGGNITSVCGVFTDYYTPSL